MSRIGVDLDDVVCSYVPALLQFINTQHGTEYTVADVKQWNIHECIEREEQFVKAAMDHFMYSGGFSNLQPIPGAIETINRLKNNGHQIYFITSRSSKATHDTYEWMDAHGLGIENIFFDRDKAWVAKRLGLDMFVDDNLSNLDAISERGIETICFDHPWNRTFGRRAHMRYHKWEDIYNHIEDTTWRQ